MEYLKLLLFSILFLNLNININLAQDCNVQGLPYQDQYPTFPNRFQTRLELDFVQSKKTIDVRLYYDYERRRIAFETKSDNTILKRIYNYDTDEVYEIYATQNRPESFITPPEGRPIYPSVCLTQKLSTYKSINFLNVGFVQVNQTFLAPVTPDKLLFYQPQGYNGSKEEAGIICDEFLSCIQDPATNTQFSMNYFFSTRDQILPSTNGTFNRIPVRALYKTATETIHYQFHEFRPHITQHDVFSTPSTVFCEKRKKTKELPKLKENFGYSEEILDRNMIYYIKDLYYSYEHKVLRYEVRGNENDFATFNVKDPLVIVSDYNIGVQYGINQNTGQCYVRGIRSNDYGEDLEFEANLNSSGLGFAIRLKSPESFLSLDSEYLHTAVRDINGIPSDIFISNRTDFRINSIYEYSFSLPDFQLTNDQQAEKSIPVALNIEVPSANRKSRYNYFNFDTSPSPNGLFDLSDCFNETETILVRVTIPYKGLALQSQLENRINIQDQILTAFYKSTDEPSIRFSRPLVTVSVDGNIYGILRIHPRPPPLTLFAFMQSTLLLVPAIQSFYSMPSAESCAIKCIERVDCLSFDYGKTSRICFLNRKHYLDPTSTSIGSSYDHYSRNTQNGTILRESYDLYSFLLNKTNSNQLYVDLTLSQNNLLKLNITSIEAIQANLNRFGTTNALNNYVLKLSNSRFSGDKDVVPSKVSIDDCAKACSEKIGYECKSFDYCYLSGDCRLSQDQAPSASSTNDYAQVDNCDIYEKNALFHYSLFRSKASINGKDKKFINVDSPNQCASKCDSEKDIQCKSFNFCPNTHLCYLSETHLIDGSQDSSTIDLTCDHYSRKYIYDFTYISNENITLDGEVVLSGSNLDQCSYSCVTLDGFNCKSFEYCPETQTCLLNSDYQKKDQNSQQKVNKTYDVCAHYRREYFYLTSLLANAKKSSDSSEDVLLVFSIIFAAVSVVGGASLSLFVLKKRCFK